MDKSETSGDHSVHQELPSMFVRDEPVLKNDSPSVDREQKCVTGILSPLIEDYGNTEVEMYSPNTKISSVHLKQAVLHHEETSRDCQETQDRSVPYEQPSVRGSGSPLSSSAVPAADVFSSPTLCQEEEQRENTANKKGSGLIELLTVADGSLDCLGNERRSDAGLKINQDQDELLPDDGDSYHSQYSNNVGECVDDFNQQYQAKTTPKESTAAEGEFSPETFFSSIPSFNRNEKKQEAETKEQTDKSAVQIHVEQNVNSPMRPSGLVISNPHFALMRHSGCHGVPIAPKPDPNSKVSCYILVVPAPVYYEKFATRDSFPVRQEQPTDNSLVAGELSNIGESVATPEAQVQGSVHQGENPEWTPRSVLPSRNNWLSTMMRVSPSPNNGKESSPVITVSTTSTPIQPLCGHRQQYVIVQGNNRHLKSFVAHRERACRNSGHDNRQPIYLQGLPPQGFRRLWKSKRDSSTHEKNRRPLVPLFPKFSPSLIEEATVPQIEKSPLTCVRMKQPSEREVPDGTTMLSGRVAVDQQTSPQPDEQTPNTNSTTAKQREDKEKKKQRERRYDAALKEGLETLRRLVPGLQRSYSRGIILQETVKHIGNLQKKIEEARNSTSTQAREGILATSQMRDVTHNQVTCKDLPEAEISQLVETENTRLEHGCSDDADKRYAEDASSLFMVEAQDGAGDSPGEGVEEVALCIPSHPLHGLSPSPRHLLPYCTSRSPQLSVSEEPFTTFVPVVEVPFYTEGIEHSGGSSGTQLSPRSDVILSAMTTISQEGLNDLGVNLSPLLSPQGILLSPEGYLTGDHNIAVLFGNREAVDTDHMNLNCCGMDEEVISGLCTDMTSIAASVEVTTDQSMKEKSSGNGIQRRSPRFRNASSSAQTVPSVSPEQVSYLKPKSPRARNRRVLRENSNFKESKSPMGGLESTGRKRLKDRSPKQSRHHCDENVASVTRLNRTPPGRVSDVILSRRKKTPSPRGGLVTKRTRRV